MTPGRILCPRAGDRVQVAFSNGTPEEVAWSVTGSQCFFAVKVCAFHPCAKKTCWNQVSYSVDLYQLYDPRFCSNSDLSGISLLNHLESPRDVHVFFFKYVFLSFFPMDPLGCVRWQDLLHPSQWTWPLRCIATFVVSFLRTTYNVRDQDLSSKAKRLLHMCDSQNMD